jgi:Tfp pilus assembly protein PilF
VIPEAQNIVSRYVQQRALLFSAALLTMLFVITAALARTYHAREEGLAAEWLQEGNADLANGKPAQAFEDFRNSLSYGPDDPAVQLRLAEALLADGRSNEARSYLVNLWDRTPGSGQLNLDLARVSQQAGEVEDAIRYYHGAIFGSWEKNPSSERRNVRLELCEFLLARSRIDQAQAEIAGLAADTPFDNGVLREENGRLFSKVGQPGRALSEFEAALGINPNQSQWLAEAAQVAFEDGDYLKAETYFARSERENPSEAIRGSLALVRDALGNDPFLAGLNVEEQARRTRRDFRQGLNRLSECVATGAKHSTPTESQSELQQLNNVAKDLQKRLNVASLTKNSDARADVMNFVFRVENATARECGRGETLDQAMRLIEKRHEVSSQ